MTRPSASLCAKCGENGKIEARPVSQPHGLGLMCECAAGGDSGKNIIKCCAPF